MTRKTHYHYEGAKARRAGKVGRTLCGLDVASTRSQPVNGHVPHVPNPCRRCSRAVADTTVERVLAPQPSRPPVPCCPECGHQLSPLGGNCWHCGWGMSVQMEYDAYRG